MCCAALSFQPCLTLRPPWTADRQAPLSMGILQARILEWVAMTSSRGFSSPRDQTQVSCIADRFFTVWATREVQEYWGLSHLHTIFVLYWAHLCIKCSLDISNFLEEISSVYHPIVFLYFLALIAEEGFLISPCYSLELSIHMGVSFLFSVSFYFSCFHSYLQGLLRQPFCFFAFFFLGHGLFRVSCTMSQTSIHSLSGTLSIESSSLSLFLTSTVYSRDLI